MTVRRGDHGVSLRHFLLLLLLEAIQSYYASKSGSMLASEPSLGSVPQI
jgi:hypothetical protein